MTTNDKLRDAFVTALGASPNADIENFKYGAIEEWDSTGHMALVAEIENAFGIMLSTDEVIDLSSFEKAREIVSKYGASVEA